MKISDLLCQCGVKNNDTVVVHCALKDGGEELKALLEELTAFFARGVLIMPTGEASEFSTPNGIFDPRRTPSGQGELSEMFRSLPGVVRSCHPAGSLAALGNGSQWLMEGHEKCISAFSSSSPWWKLFQEGVKCIFIGCGLERSGMIAAAEEWAGTAVFFKRFRRRRLALENGKNKRLRIRMHTKKHCRNYPKVEDLFRDAGILSRCRWGEEDLLVMNGAAAASLLLRLLHRKPDVFASMRRLRNLKIV